MSEWRVEAEVAMTEAEAVQAARLQPAANRRSSAWMTLGVGALVGFLVAFAALLAGVVAPRPAGVIAALGFMSFWAGLWYSYWLGRRVWRDRMASYLARTREPWRATLSRDGMRAEYPDRYYMLGWSYFSRVDDRGGLLIFWTKSEASNIVLPKRCFAATADIERAVAQVGANSTQ